MIATASFSWYGACVRKLFVLVVGVTPAVALACSYILLLAGGVIRCPNMCCLSQLIV